MEYQAELGATLWTCIIIGGLVVLYVLARIGALNGVGEIIEAAVD